MEYQNTSKVPVAKHENNDFMESRPGRKGDGKRWRVQYLLSKALKMPVLVIVWSRTENVTRLKRVRSFDINDYGLVSHINWGECVLDQIDSVTEETIIELIK